MMASRRPVNIQPTSPDDCHSTIAWLPATFDHVNITGDCVSCHNGTEATGKTPTHIQTTNVCEDCHTSNVWAPVFTVDHTQVLGTCGSCHDGVTATGKHPTHITSGNTCDDCHSTTGWLPANFDHVNITGDCVSCRGLPHIERLGARVYRRSHPGTGRLRLLP
jgi:predicted CXXCH cytochrome family protein